MFGFRMCPDEGGSMLLKHSEYASRGGGTIIHSYTRRNAQKIIKRVVTKKLRKVSSNLFIEAIKFHGCLYDDDDDKLKA